MYFTWDPCLFCQFLYFFSHSTYVGREEILKLLKNPIVLLKTSCHAPRLVRGVHTPIFNLSFKKKNTGQGEQLYHPPHLLPWTNKRLYCKGEPYRFRGNPSLQTERDPVFFFIGDRNMFVSSNLFSYVYLCRQLKSKVPFSKILQM